MENALNNLDNKVGIRTSRRNIIIGAIILIIIIALLFWFLSPIGYRSIRVMDFGGEVTYDREDTQNVPVYSGMSLASGDTLRTGGDESFSRLVLDSDKYVFVEQNSEVAFELAGRIGSSNTTLNLKYGAIINELENKLSEGETYEVRTPNAVMAVRGTRFRVSVYTGSDGILYTRVVVFEGTVSCQLVYPNGSRSDEILLTPGGNETLIYYDSDIDITDFVTSDGDATHIINYRQLPRQVLDFLRLRLDEGAIYDAIDTTYLLDQLTMSDNMLLPEPEIGTFTIGSDSIDNESGPSNEQDDMVAVTDDEEGNVPPTSTGGSRPPYIRDESAQAPVSPDTQQPEQSVDDETGDDSITPQDPIAPDSSSDTLTFTETAKAPELPDEPEQPQVNYDRDQSSPGTVGSNLNTPAAETFSADSVNAGAINNAFTRTNLVNISPGTPGSAPPNIGGVRVSSGQALSIDPGTRVGVQNGSLNVSNGGVLNNSRGASIISGPDATGGGYSGNIVLSDDATLNNDGDILLPVIVPDGENANINSNDGNINGLVIGENSTLNVNGNINVKELNISSSSSVTGTGSIAAEAVSGSAYDAATGTVIINGQDISPDGNGLYHIDPPRPPTP